MRKTRAVCGGNLRKDMHADELQPVAFDKSLDRAKQGLVFLHMEQHIATFARGVVVIPP
jgi:hypothetical protein